MPILKMVLKVPGSSSTQNPKMINHNQYSLVEEASARDASVTDDLEAFLDWVRVQSIGADRLADVSVVGPAHLTVTTPIVSTFSWLKI